jgi:hypothetical protein
MSQSSDVPAAREPTHTQSFMLRVWPEDAGNGQIEWRGKVQHVTSGEARYFRDWPALVACLREMLNDQTERI